MGSGMRLPVDAPLPRPPETSLLLTLSALNRLEGSLGTAGGESTSTPGDGPGEGDTINTGTGDRWVNGVTFSPEACGSGTGILDPCGSTQMSAGDPAEDVDLDPGIVWAGINCTTMDPGRDRAELARRVRVLLDVCQHQRIAGEFWQGNLARSSSSPTPYLAQGGTTIAGDGAVPVLDALAGLEEIAFGLGTDACGCGGAAIIHASPTLVTLWNAAGLVTRQGPLIRTILNTVVVSGPGYDGSGPGEDPGDDPVPPAEDGTSTWAYVTGLPTAKVGPVTVRSAVDPMENLRAVYAQRPAFVTWDDCCHVAMNVNLAARS